MFRDDARDVLAVEIPAGHDDNSAFSPEPGGGKDFAMPEGVDEALSKTARGFPVLPALDFPAHGPANQMNGQVADPACKDNLKMFPKSEGARAFAKSQGLFFSRGRALLENSFRTPELLIHQQNSAICPCSPPVAVTNRRSAAHHHPRDRPR